MWCACPICLCRCLQLLQKLVLSADLVGQALVPYYRQLLPIFNLYITRCAVRGGGAAAVVYACRCNK